MSTSAYIYLPIQYLYMDKMKMEFECYLSLDKEVKKQKNSGAVYVPKAWIGKKARVLLLEPIQDE